LATALHGSHRLRSRRSALGQPPACRHNSEGRLQWLAHTQVPRTVGCLPRQPLSPLLFALAVQPMSAHARQLAAQQALHGLRLPDGQPSPFLHLHADDTTVHASSPADAQAILDGSVALHIDATEARLQRSKSSGMGIGSLQHLGGLDPATAIMARMLTLCAFHTRWARLIACLLADMDCLDCPVSRLRLVPPTRAWLMHAWHRALWILPPREGGPLGCLHVTRGSPCHGKAASPVVGRAVYACIPEVSFSCPLMLLRWQIWLT